MTIFKKLSICLLIAVAAIQLGCKKGAQGETGPAGPADPNTGLFSNGSYVKGTVTTTTQAAEAVSFTFNHAYLDSDPEFGGNGSTSEFYLYKDFKGWSNNDYSYVALNLDSISDLIPANPYMEIYTESLIGADTLFSFYYGDNVTVTNYTYNSSTRTISGNFTGTSTNTNNGNSATVTGSFKFVGIVEPVQ